MKKFLLILLTTVYAITALGMNVHFFYCCKKLSHISISAAQPMMDGCKTKTKKCCTNKTISIKLTTDQDKTAIKHLSVSSFTVVPISYYTIGNNGCKSLFINPKHPLTVPPPNLPSLQVLYCVFRI